MPLIWTKEQNCHFAWCNGSPTLWASSRQAVPCILSAGCFGFLWLSDFVGWSLWRGHATKLIVGTFSSCMITSENGTFNLMLGCVCFLLVWPHLIPIPVASVLESAYRVYVDFILLNQQWRDTLIGFHRADRVDPLHRELHQVFASTSPCSCWKGSCSYGGLLKHFCHFVPPEIVVTTLNIVHGATAREVPSLPALDVKLYKQQSPELTFECQFGCDPWQGW